MRILAGADDAPTSDCYMRAAKRLQRADEKSEFSIGQSSFVVHMSTTRGMIIDGFSFFSIFRETYVL